MADPVIVLRNVSHESKFKLLRVPLSKLNDFVFEGWEIVEGQEFITFSHIMSNTIRHARYKEANAQPLTVDEYDTTPARLLFADLTGKELINLVKEVSGVEMDKKKYVRKDLVMMETAKEICRDHLQLFFDLRYEKIEALIRQTKSRAEVKRDLLRDSGSTED